jgi:predicted nucleic acid-binding protein
LIHLDTSFLVRALHHGSPEDAALREWIKAGEEIAASALAWTEFLIGPLSQAGIDIAAELLGEPLAFGAPESAAAAMLFNKSGRRRGSLVDCMIAAVALEAGAELATANVRDFRRLETFGLRIATTA